MRNEVESTQVSTPSGHTSKPTERPRGGQVMLKRALKSSADFAEQEALLAPSIGPVQRRRKSDGPDAEQGVQDAARSGVSGSSHALPHLAAIQQSFGRHDVGGIQAHTDQSATKANAAMGAAGFAMGPHVAFAESSPSLHLAAHEAAHVVQQRGGVQLYGGVGRDGDTHERHADAVADLVVQGKSAESLLDTYGPTRGESRHVQRKGTALDVVAIQTGNFTWTYIQSLAKQHAVEQTVITALKRGLEYLVAEAFEIIDVSSYIKLMAPYIDVLTTIKKMVDSIPEPIRVLLLQGIGWAVRQFSVNYMYGAITEAHINSVLIEGADFVAQLGKLIDFLDSLKNPAAAVSKAIWSVVETVGWSVTGKVRSMWGWVSGSSSSEAGDSGSEGDEEGGPEVSPEEPMVDANLGWFWLEAQQPRIARWKDDDSATERGGLELDGRFGVKVFGNTMGADKVQLRVPYGGDWNVDLTNVSLLSNPITLGKVFKGGPIAIEHMSFGNKGLRHLRLIAKDFSFGDGVVTAPLLSMEYDAGNSSLAFAGSTVLKAFGHTIEGQLGLTVGTDGQFKGGKAELSSPDSFTLLQDRLTLDNPMIAASWSADGADLIEIGGDLGLNLFDAVQLASEQTRIRYEKGIGFQGQVAKIWANVPVHKGGTLRFELLEGLVDRNGFKAQKISLIYAYGEALDDKRQEDGTETPKDGPKHGGALEPSLLSKLVPGLNLDWIAHSGLETLVVDLSASDVSLDSEGLSIGELKKELSKFKASVFGVGAEFDGKKRSGAVKGKFEHKVQPVRMAVAFPIVPGIHAGLSFATELGVDADLNLAAQRAEADPGTPHLHPWKLNGLAGIGAHAGLELAAEIGLGVPMLAELNGGLFARASVAVRAEAKAAGTVLWNDDAHRIQLPEAAKDKPSAEVAFKVSPKAELGAQVRASLFFNMIDKQLWSYRFLEWQMGDWQLAGKLEATEEGGYEFTQTKMGFDGKDGLPKTKPVVEQQRVRADELITETKTKGKKLTDEGQVWRLVHELQDPGNSLPRQKKIELYNDLEAINATRVDVDGAAMEVMQMAQHRAIDGRDELSLLMTREEWIKYSTTVSSGEKRTERKSVVGIDEALGAYHRAAPNERMGILDRLEALITKYNDQWFVSRKEMSQKLSSDVQRERTRLILREEAAARSTIEG